MGNLQDSTQFSYGTPRPPYTCYIIIKLLNYYHHHHHHHYYYLIFL